MLSKVVFIGGYGRSGSTLLEAGLAAASSDIVAVGELRHLWTRGLVNNELCGCGQRFHDCEFWTKVLGQVFPNGGPAPSALDALWRQVDRVRFIPWMLSNRSAPKRFAAAHRRYLNLLRRLYVAIARVSGRPIVVDSSKEVASSVLAAQAVGTHLHYVHLVRHPQAVAHSWSRVRVRPEAVSRREIMARTGPVRAGIEWLQRGVFGEVMRIRVGGSLVRYEDFVREPAATLAAITERHGAFSRLDPGSREIPRVGVHSVSGNPLRFAEGPVHVRMDDRWVHQMKRTDRLLNAAATWPGMVYFRYGMS